MSRYQPETLSKAKAKYFSSLSLKKNRQECQKFLVEGLRLCEELLNSDVMVDSFIITEKIEQSLQGKELLAKIECKSIPVFRTTDEILQKIGDTCAPQPVMACAQMRSHDLTQNFFTGKRFLVLVDLNEPGNVGTLLRTAEAFCWDGVLLLGSSVELYNPKIVRSSMGSIFRLSIACSSLDNAMSFFEYTHVPYFVTVPRQGMLPPFLSLPDKLALFLGNEAHGLPESLVQKATGILQIPINPLVDSLNVAIAGGILLFLSR